MELLWMTVISLVAVAVAVMIGDKMETRLTLKMDVRDQAKLQKQVEELTDDGIIFAEACYCKGLVSLHQVKALAAEYVRCTLKELYKTKLASENNELEALVDERMEKAVSLEKI